MNASDGPQTPTEEEKLTAQKDKELATLDREPPQLIEYLGELKITLQQQFFPHYCDSVLQDLAIISQKQGKMLQDDSFIDLVSSKSGPSDNEVYDHLKAFKEAVSQRPYAASVKRDFLAAVQREMDLMRPQASNSQSTSWGPLQPLLNLVTGDTSTVDSKFLEEVHAMRVATYSRAPDNRSQEMQAIRQGNANVDDLCAEVIQTIRIQQRHFDTRVNDFIDRLDVKYDQFRNSVRRPPASIDEQFAPQLADRKRAAMHFRDSLKNSLEDLNKELNSKFYRLGLRQAYVTELIKGDRLPSFALLKDHQVLQQKFLDSAIQMTLRLLDANSKYYQAECQGNCPPPIHEVCDRVQQLSVLLIKLQHMQDMQRLQRDRINAICATGERENRTERSSETVTSVPTIPRSNAVKAMVPLLVAQSTNKSTPAKVDYDDSSVVNKPSLAATTIFQDNANEESFLLVQGAPNPSYQVVRISDPQSRERIKAAKFGMTVKGKISQGRVEVELVPAEKRSKSPHR